MNINNFGKYWLGLTQSEIREYIKLVTKNKKVGKIFRIVLQQSYGSTGVIEDGEFLYYRDDVKKWINWAIKGTPYLWD